MNAVRALKKDLFLLWQKLGCIEKNSYRFWRLRILYTCIIAYAGFYLMRQNFSLALPSLEAEFGYSKTSLGWIITWFSLCYGVGKFVNGYLSDRSNARYFLTLGLAGSCLVCFMSGAASTILVFGMCWICNSWFQSMGWPPIARMLTQWFGPKEIGTKWALCASSHQIGAAIMSVGGGYLIAALGWRSVFFIPALVGLVVALFCFKRLRDNPDDVGLPPLETYIKHDYSTKPEDLERVTPKEVVALVLKNRLIWYMSMANFCLYIPRMGVFTWAPTFLKEYKDVTLQIAGWQLASFEAAGLVGGLMAGWLSDRVFHGRRGPVGTLFLLALAFVMTALWLTPKGFPFVDTIFLFCAGFLVYGPQVLVGVAATDFSSKKAAGVASGFAGTVAYAGSAVVGAPVGSLVDRWGWDAGFALFVVSSLLGAFFFALTWHERSKHVKHPT